ncbi:outer membrane beta-barrel protein [Longibacter sp.]|jgi:hypothetical protein|uniref:outer membrane beta-barrel protein n=1 Tax=Longibacter sp. TaxID=2045415 RepID=UPI003EB6CA5E
MTLLSSLRVSALFAFVTLAAMPAAAQSTDGASDMTLWVHAEAGYTSFSMNEATDFFRAIVGSYQDQGINIPVQQAYPGNVVTGGGATLYVGGWTSGLHVQYARTRASALYGDAGGTLDVTSEASFWTIETSTGYTFRRGHRLQPFVSARAGGGLGRYTVTERIRLSFGEETGEGVAELQARGTGYSFTGSAGVRYPVGPVFLRMEAGYRHASIGSDDDDLPFNVGYSGPVVTVGAEIPVWGIR